MRLEKRRCLVTGGGTGIGRALVQALLAKGAQVVTCGRRADVLAALAADMQSDRLTVVTADLARAEDRAHLVSETQRVLGGLDLLINNAGRVAVGPVEDIGAEVLESLFAVNVVAPYALCRDFQAILASAGGRIVMIGSMFGDIAFPLFAGYSASKFALRGLSDGLRRELAGDGIRVTYVAPRATRTPAAESFAALEKAFDMKMDEPERVADLVLATIENEKDFAFPGFAERLFRVLQVLRPAVIDKALGAKLAAYRRCA